MKTHDEALADDVAAMGIELGSTFRAIVNELAALHLVWGDYQALWGHSPERVDTLNKIAPTFFYRAETIYWRNILLHVSRLTDAPQNGAQRNLSIRGVPVLISDPVFAGEIKALVGIAVAECAFVKSWRNLALAHRDHAHAVKMTNARQIEPVSRAKLRTAIKSIEAVPIALNRHYQDCDMAFEPIYDHAGEELIAQLEQITLE